MLAATFVGCDFGGSENVAAVFEWIVAFVFTFYVLTFFLDLLPAARSEQERSNREFLRKSEVGDGDDVMQEEGFTNGPAANGVNFGNGNAYAAGAGGYDGFRTGRQPPTAQNF